VIGWKVGYLTGSAKLMHAVSKAHQFLVFTTAPNLQRSVVFELKQDDSYSDRLNDSMRGKRDRLSGALSKIPDVEPELFNRLRFAKQDQVLDDAASRLAAHFS
jgi:aspartate/methionine/tyrosine aminotransferase